MHQVFQWVLSGACEHDILDAIAKAWPGQDPKPLIVGAMKRFEAAGNQELNVVVGWCFEAYRDLYRRMVEIGDFAGALRAVKMIQDLARQS